ncbi:POT family MFS transporter [Rubinisphaera sp. JC750]|uniref:POT family MFS transporter n=1 Tax=Rubinisphaera sp. JC750 TaxID=2898658 RepID=UPI001F2B0C09|nr:POT family MFS transporter [Rubinisphaera sp. JC750]
MAHKKPATAPYDIETMPPGIPYIVGNEAAERFSFYGMKAILMIFMTEYLLGSTGELAPMTEPQAKEVMHTFGSAVYFFPLIGAIVSDWLFGKYNMIIWLSLVYCVGHAVMALVDLPQLTGLDPEMTLYIALGLIAIGSGGIKPCVSAHVGDQFGKRNQHLLTRVFQWFYFSINLGSTISTLLVPYLLRAYGPAVAFGVPGVLMALATFVFWMGRHRFVHIPPAGSSFFRETFSRDGLRALLNLTPLYIFIAMFWALFDQTASAWVLQAKEMDRVVLGQEILPDQLQAINPILVMLFIPLFSYVIYPFMGKFFEVTPLKKIGMGLFLTIAAFALPAWIEMRIAAGETPHIIWQFWSYALITAAEIMVSITGLEFSYTQAPKRMKSFVMGFYLLSVSLGNIFVAAVNHFIQDENGQSTLSNVEYYWFFTGCMAVTAVLYVIFSQFYRGNTYIQDEELAADAGVIHAKAEDEGTTGT